MLTYALLAFILGIASAGIARLIDHMMDYGNILGHVRYALFWIAASQEEAIWLYDAKAKQGFAERSDALAEVYEDIAFRVGWMRVFICTMCISIYVCIGMFLLGYYSQWTDFTLIEFVLIASGNYLGS